MIQAVVIDLDGTLIGKDEEISPRVARAVSQVSSKVPVAIATGREPTHTVKYARDLGLTSPQICDGGATILDPASGKALWTNPLGPALAQEIIRSLHAQKTAFIATHPEGAATSIARLPHWNLTRVSALDLDEPGAETLLARFSPNQELQAVKVFLPYNDLWAVDFTRSGVDKAAATLKLAQMIETDPGNMAAAGDSYNDMPLLRACGLRIAMGDAPEELKAIADYVAPSAEEDGLAVAIEEFILPRL